MRRLVPAALALAAVAPTAALAQTGPVLTATISQRFELDTNLDLEDSSPGNSYFADTRLALGFLSETPTQTFSLGFDSGLRALWKADEDFEFTFASPSSASARYNQEWANAALNSNFRARLQRVDFTRPLDDFFDPEVGEIILPDDPAQREGTATEYRYDANVNLALATDAPSSYSLGLAATSIDYSEVAGNRTPRDTVDGRLTWSLRLTPVFSGTLSGRYFRYAADNPEDTRIRENELETGLVFEPTEVLRLNAGVGYVQRERRETVGGVRQTVEDNTGLSFRSGLRYDFQDFVVDASLRVSTAADETRVSGDLRATYPLPTGSVSGRVFQSFAGGGTGDEIRVTGVSFGLLRELDPVSRINFNVAASRRENLDDPTDPDVDRLDFVSTYSYDLTAALAASIGYRFRARREDPERAQSHAVFVQISRSFDIGF
jgi:hypothetical protein